MAVVKFIPEAWVGYDALQNVYYVTYRAAGRQYTDTYRIEHFAVEQVGYIHRIPEFEILHPDTPSYAEIMRDSL